MNMTQHQGEWNILKSTAFMGSFHAWCEGMRALATKTGRKFGRIFQATAAAMFPRRHAVSALQITWAGVLRSDNDRLVPEPSDEVRFRVANEMFLCEEGKPLVFDDSWNQEAWDQMNGYRVVFLSDSARAAKEPMGRRLQHFLARLVRI